MKPRACSGLRFYYSDHSYCRSRSGIKGARPCAFTTVAWDSWIDGSLPLLPCCITRRCRGGGRARLVSQWRHLWCKQPRFLAHDDRRTRCNRSLSAASEVGLRGLEAKTAMWFHFLLQGELFEELSLTFMALSASSVGQLCHCESFKLLNYERSPVLPTGSN